MTHNSSARAPRCGNSSLTTSPDWPRRLNVNGERMNYHYFFHQFTAATSWATGVNLTDLIYNIGWMPLLFGERERAERIAGPPATELTGAGALSHFIRRIRQN